jgi:hypothetical protein
MSDLTRMYLVKSMINYSLLTNLILYRPRLNMLQYIKCNKSLKSYFYDNLYNWCACEYLPMSDQWMYSISPYVIKRFLETKNRFMSKKLMYNIGFKNKINHKLHTKSNLNGNTLRVLHQSTRRELKNGKYIEMHYHRYRG